MRSTVEISVVCVSVCLSVDIDVRTFGRKKICRFNPIRTLILHIAGENLAASMRITRGSRYKDKSSR